MNVLLITHEFPPVGGGVGEVAYYLASFLKDKNISVSILTCKYLSFPLTQIERIRIYTVPGFRRSYLQNIKTLTFISFIFLGFFKAVHIIKKDKISLIHCLMTIPSGFIGWLLFKSTRTKYITSLHGSDVPYHSKNKIMILLRPVVKRIWQDSTAITAVSQTLLNCGLETYNPPQNKKIIIPNGINLDFIEHPKKHQPHDGVFTIVSISRLLEFKGIQDVIRSLALFNKLHTEVNYRYKIIGDGPYLKTLRELVKVNSLDGQVVFLGFLDKDNIIKELDKSHIFILPSYYESFGIVYLQAFARGLPIICSRTTGISEIMDESLGLCVDAGNLQQITNAISTIYSKYIKYNPETIREKAMEYSWDHISRRYIDLYKLYSYEQY